MSNINNKKPTDKSGLYKGERHNDPITGEDLGGIEVIVDGVKKVEVEGEEYHICNEAMESNEIYEFKDKSNKQILDRLFREEGCIFEQGKASGGDFIACRLVVLDDNKRDIKGTVKEILNILQSEKACRMSSDSDSKKLGGVYKTKSQKYDCGCASANKELDELISKKKKLKKQYNSDLSTLEIRKIENRLSKINKRIKKIKLDHPPVGNSNLGERITLLEEMVKSNPKDKKLKERLDLLVDMYEDGGQLKKGIEVEKEHIATIEKIYDHKVSKEKAPELIAKDHLKEVSDYYDRLPIVEGGSKQLITLAGTKSKLSKTQYEIVRSPEFKLWFGDWEKAYLENNYSGVSKAINKNDGEPSVFYHGALSDNGYLPFTSFGKSNWSGLFFFSKDYNWVKSWIAERSAVEETGEYIYTVFLNYKNPFDPSDDESVNRLLEALPEQIEVLNYYAGYIDQYVSKLKFVEILKSNQNWLALESEMVVSVIKSLGFDAILLKEGENNTVAVFNSNQIKLADGTNITFDIKENDIRMEIGGLFHGSTKNFNSFTLNEIGKGSGEQQYGWGIYFSNSETIAKYYANVIIKDKIEELLQNVDEKYQYAILSYLAAANYSTKSAIEIVKQVHSDVSETDKEKIISILNEIEHKVEGYRYIYHVTLNKNKSAKDYDYILWDELLTRRQRDKILLKIETLPESSPYANKRIKSLLKAPDWIRTDTGERVYQTITDSIGKGIKGQKETSKFLMECGIDGIEFKYVIPETLVETKNYVVFDERNISINSVEKFNNGGVFDSEIELPTMPIDERIVSDFIMSGGLFDFDMAKYFAQKYLNYEIVSELNAGSKGTAFILKNGNILKFTSSRPEAIFCYRLEKKNLKYHANIYSVTQIGVDDKFYVIEREYIDPLPPELKQWYNTMVGIQKGVDKNEFSEKIKEKTEGLSPESEAIILKLFDNFRLMLSELESNGTRPNDFFADNVGFKDGNVACFDCKY